MTTSRLREAIKETAKDLYADKLFWLEAGAAVVPWLINTTYQINYGQSPIPYTEEALHVFRGPVCARIVSTFMKNYHDRDLTNAEKIGYSLAGGLIGGGFGSARELVTKSIPTGVLPYIAKWTPSFDAAETAQDVFFTVIGSLSEPLISKARKPKQ